MLTEDDIKRIQELKNRGYAKARVAKTLGMSRGTVSKFWGERGQSLSLSALNQRFDECFEWDTCDHCGVMYWAPKFLPRWQCPGCKRIFSWTECSFKQKSKAGKSRDER